MGSSSQIWPLGTLSRWLQQASRVLQVRLFPQGGLCRGHCLQQALCPPTENAVCPALHPPVLLQPLPPLGFASLLRASGFSGIDPLTMIISIFPQTFLFFPKRSGLQWCTRSCGALAQLHTSSESEKEAAEGLVWVYLGNTETQKQSVEANTGVSWFLGTTKNHIIKCFLFIILLRYNYTQIN